MACRNGRTVRISSWKCNFSIYLDIQVYYLNIQAITTLVCLLLVLYVWFLLFIHFSILQPLSWKVTFSGTQKTTRPTVFNLQASVWVHCEEETGAYYKLSLFAYKLLKKNTNFEVKKNMRFSKNSLKFIINIFFKKMSLGIRIYVLNAMTTSNLLYISSLLHECPQTPIYFL